MSNTTNRVKGAIHEVGGKAKQAIGEAIGNEQMQAEGAATALAGQAEQATAKVGERAKGLVEEVTGAAKERLGAALGNEQMQVEGAARKVIGAVRKKTNQ